MDVRAALAALLGPVSCFLIHRTTVILGRGGPNNVCEVFMDTPSYMLLVRVTGLHNTIDA